MVWWIATVSPSCERRADATLSAAGLIPWLPMRSVEVKHRHMRKAEPRDYPLMPGYIFARPCACRSSSPWEHVWQVIRSADGVRGILANQGRPLTLTDGTIAILQKRLEVPAVAIMLDYRVGQPVRIVDTNSPFCGLDAVVHASDRRAVTVLMDLMGRKTPVELFGEQLELVA